MGFYIIDDLTQKLVLLTPFGLKDFFAGIRDIFGVGFGKFKIRVVIDYNFQFVGFFVDAGVWFLEFLGRKANPIKFTGKWMRA